MADSTISALASGSTPSGSESIPVVQSGVTVKLTAQQIANTVSNATVISKVLTGYVSGAGTVQPTDSILQAIQKLNGNLVASTAKTIRYMLALTASDIATYNQQIELTVFTPGALTTITTAVTTTPTLLKAFATNINNPNITVLPSGSFLMHYETQKAAGSNNYRTYYEIYKRTQPGGVETLIATSDYSSETSVNTVVQNTVYAFSTANVALNATDRIVVKIYAQMLSSSANIDLRFDNNTNARFELPTVSGGGSTTGGTGRGEKLFNYYNFT